MRRGLVPRGPEHDGLLDLASNDYLGLCGDERITAAAPQRPGRSGTGSGTPGLPAADRSWPAVAPAATRDSAAHWTAVRDQW